MKPIPLLSPIPVSLCALVFLLVAPLQASAVTAIDEPFDTFQSSVWTVATGGGQHAVSVSGGVLTATVGNLNDGHRSTLISTAGNLNPFSAPVTITISGLTLGGNTGVTDYTKVGTNVFYLMLGNVGDSANGTSNLYYPTASVPAGNSAGYAALEIYTHTDGTLRIALRGRDASGSSFSITPKLNGMPASVSLTLVGNNYTLSPSGTKPFIDTVATSLSGTLTGMTASWFSQDSYLAVGAINRNVGGYGVNGATEITLDSLLVTTTAVPEPRMSALIGAALVGFFVVRSRRAAAAGRAR